MTRHLARLNIAHLLFDIDDTFAPVVGDGDDAG